MITDGKICFLVIILDKCTLNIIMFFFLIFQIFMIKSIF